MSRDRGGSGAIWMCHPLMLPRQFYIGVELGLGGERRKKEKKRNGGSLSAQVQIWKTSMANLKCQIIRTLIWTCLRSQILNNHDILSKRPSDNKGVVIISGGILIVIFSRSCCHQMKTWKRIADTDSNIPFIYLKKNCISLLWWMRKAIETWKNHQRLRNPGRTYKIKILPSAAVTTRHLCKSVHKTAVIIQRNYLALRKTLPRNDGGVWQEKLSKDWHQSRLSVASRLITCTLQRACQNRSLTRRRHADGRLWEWLMGWPASIWD